LLDTGVALTAVDAPERLTAPVRTGIEQGPAFLSVISYWEVMIKSQKGNLDVGDPRIWWSETLDALALEPLLFRPEHVTEIYYLPSYHADPFDRALIAQATAKDLTVLTTDSEIPRYASERFRAIR
jgi:PIN domain nuclease of toxin-antitoxin system